jgi:hypothetical protein
MSPRRLEAFSGRRDRGDHHDHGPQPSSTGLVPWISLGAYIAVSLVWLVPDRRMERVIDA